MKPSRYDEWVTSLFSQTVSEYGSHLQCDELWNDNAHFAELTIWLLRHCALDLGKMSDESVAFGLKHTFKGFEAEPNCPLKSGDISREMKIELIRSFESLYSGCFESRCAPILLHLGEPGGSSLNQFCFMLWDSSPLGSWNDHKDPEEFYTALVEMLKKVLLLSNPACVESALHGLGHLHPECPRLVENAIDECIDRGLNENLLKYALCARSGDVL